MFEATFSGVIREGPSDQRCGRWGSCEEPGAGEERAFQPGGSESPVGLRALGRPAWASGTVVGD